MCDVIKCHGSTAQKQSAFSLEAGPAIGNEALAGTRRSVFFFFGCSPILYVRTWYHTVVAFDNNSILRTPLKPRLVVHTHKVY